MQFKNTPDAYGAITKALHWIIALGIIFMLCLGVYMDGMAAGLTKLKAYNLHKSIGITILFLAIVRIGWHAYSRKPALAAGMKPWEIWAAHTMHFCLYLAMIGMPLSGWLLSSAAGRPVSFFGFVTLPDLIAPNDDLRGLFGTLHWLTAWALALAIPAHLLAALKHHFINKDATLVRMLPFVKK